MKKYTTQNIINLAFFQHFLIINTLETKINLQDCSTTLRSIPKVYDMFRIEFYHYENMPNIESTSYF